MSFMEFEKSVLCNSMEFHKAWSSMVIFEFKGSGMEFRELKFVILPVKLQIHSSNFHGKHYSTSN